MKFEKLSAPSLKDLFVKQMQGMILSGELAQGTALRLIGVENAVFGGWTQEERETYLALTQRYLTDFRAVMKEQLG